MAQHLHRGSQVRAGAQLLGVLAEAEEILLGPLQVALQGVHLQVVVRRVAGVPQVAEGALQVVDGERVPGRTGKGHGAQLVAVLPHGFRDDEGLAQPGVVVPQGEGHDVLSDVLVREAMEEQRSLVGEDPLREPLLQGEELVREVAGVGVDPGPLLLEQPLLLQALQRVGVDPVLPGELERQGALVLVQEVPYGFVHGLPPFNVTIILKIIIFLVYLLHIGT